MDLGEKSAKAIQRKLKRRQRKQLKKEQHALNKHLGHSSINDDNTESLSNDSQGDGISCNASEIGRNKREKHSDTDSVKEDSDEVTNH